MCISLDMPNIAWDIMTQYIIDDRHDHRNAIKKYCLKLHSHMTNMLVNTHPAGAYSMSAKQSKSTGQLFPHENYCNNLCHMKIIANVTKSSHQDLGPCYLHLLIFLIPTLSFSVGKEEVIVIAVFLSKLDDCSMIYINITILV